MKYFTNSFKILTDGFSTHYLERISSIIFAEKYNLKFLYTPLLGMGHNYEDDANYLKRKEQFMNLIEHFPINTDLEFHKSCPESCEFFAYNVSYCYHSLAFAKIKELFFFNKHRDQYFSNDYKHVAIHMRKCNPHDIEPPCEFSNGRFYQIIQQLRVYFHAEPLKFHIYSQGSLDNFKEFENNEDIVLHINDTVENTFSSMVFADVLVTCQSAYCRLAGYLSSGLVIYPREVVTPLNLLPHFKIIE